MANVTIPISDKNGQQQMRPMPKSRRASIEAGLTALQETEHERDSLRDERDELRIKLASALAEVESLKAMFSRAQTEVEAYRRERDWEVAKRAEFEAVFNAVAVLMVRHQRKTKTVIGEAEENGATGSDAGGDAGHSAAG